MSERASASGTSSLGSPAVRSPVPTSSFFDKGPGNLPGMKAF